MTKFDEERRAADIRYAKARRAVESLTGTETPAATNAAVAELTEAHRSVTRLARRAGSEAMKEGAET
jgi:hypothetical protein